MHTDRLLRITLTTRLCVYCGELAGTQEHFPPKASSNRGLVLSACKECNCLASTVYPFDFSRRAGHVKRRLEKRAARWFKIPDWTEEQLQEMSPRMQREIRGCLREKKRGQERIAWNAEDYLLSIVQTQGSVVPLAGIISMPKNELDWLEALSWLTSEPLNTTEPILPA